MESWPLWDSMSSQAIRSVKNSILTEMKVLSTINYLLMKTLFSHPNFSDLAQDLVERNPESLRA